MATPTDRQRNAASALSSLVVAAAIIVGVTGWAIAQGRPYLLAHLAGTVVVCGLFFLWEWGRRHDREWAETRRAVESVIAILAALAFVPFRPDTQLPAWAGFAVALVLAGVVSWAAVGAARGVSLGLDKLPRFGERRRDGAGSDLRES